MRRLLALLLLLTLAAPAAAAACPKTSLADVEDEVMCPVCGVPLGLATRAPQAERQREFIQRQVQSCKSKKQIKTALVAEFGDRVLAMPPPDKGVNLAVYLVPAAIVLAGGAAIGVIAFRRKREPGAPAVEGPSLEGADQERLEKDLARYER